MKALFIHHITEMHGSTISLFTLIKGLMENGVEASLIVPEDCRRDESFMLLVTQLQIKIYYISIVFTCDFSGWSRKPWRFREFCHKLSSLIYLRKSCFRQICRVIEVEKPDVVHTNVGIIHDGYWAARKYNIPHVFHIREYQDLDFGWKILPTKWLFERFLMKSDSIITITDDIRQHFNLCKCRKAQTIYNGIFEKTYRPINEKRENQFLFASRVSPEKDPELVIDAFSHFYQNHKDWKLLVAGAGEKEYCEELKELSRRQKCEEGVQFLGFVDDVKNLMLSSKALVVGSRNEGFGRMTAEAAFCGCVVLGRNTAGTKEIINSVGGFLFGNSSELVKYMEQVASWSTDSFTQMATNAQEKASELFSVEQNVEKVMSVYRTILLNDKISKTALL